MRILITGGAGFIGSHTADLLLAQGHEVRILDIVDPQIHGRKANFPDYLDSRIECYRGDVRRLDDVLEALTGVDVVFHLAAFTGVGQSMYDMRSYVETNCGGTATVIEAIVKSGKPIKRLVVASSRAVYGEGTHACKEHGPHIPEPRKREHLEQGVFDIPCPTCGTPLVSQPTVEDRPLKPMSVYAWTKKQQEDYCQYAANVFALPVTVLRYFNVYGSRQSLQNPYTGVVSIFYSRIKAGNAISLYERGKPTRDFVHVSDVARANVLAIEADIPPGSCINVGSGNEATIRDIANALGHALKTTVAFEDKGEFRVGDIHACSADLQKAGALLKYTPRVSLTEGMQEFAAWAATQSSADHYEKAVAELSRYGLFGRAKPKH